MLQSAEGAHRKEWEEEMEAGDGPRFLDVFDGFYFCIPGVFRCFQCGFMCFDRFLVVFSCFLLFLVYFHSFSLSLTAQKPGSKTREKRS